MNMISISLCENMIFIAVAFKYFACYGRQLKVSIDLHSGKNENWHLFLSHCRYFDKSFSEMFVEWASTKHILFVQTSQFNWLSWQPNKRLNL